MQTIALREPLNASLVSVPIRYTGKLTDPGSSIQATRGVPAIFAVAADTVFECTDGGLVIDERLSRPAPGPSNR